MKSYLFCLFALLLSLPLSLTLSAQDEAATEQDPKPVMQKGHDMIARNEYQLVALFDKIRTSRVEEDRFAANDEFIPMLVKTLQYPNSFSYPFDSLKSVSILNAPDNSFRIMTWMIVKGDVPARYTYKYFGCIQMNDSDDFRIFPLIDHSTYLSSPTTKTLTHDEWYGNLYYNIKSYEYDGKQHYLLFGWDANNGKSDKKIMDVLTFDEEGAPSFGQPIFQIKNENETLLKSRFILEYKDGSLVTLNYSDEEEGILFDYLTSEDSESARVASTGFAMVPDGTYRGMKLNPETGIWEFVAKVFNTKMKTAPRPAPVFDNNAKPATVGDDKKSKKKNKKRPRPRPRP